MKKNKKKADKINIELFFSIKDEGETFSWKKTYSIMEGNQNFLHTNSMWE